MKNFTLVYHSKTMNYIHFSFQAESEIEAWAYIHWKFNMDMIKVVKLLNE